MGFSDEQNQMIFSIVAGILHLGDLQFLGNDE
jgi:myosin heavy subunit